MNLREIIEEVNKDIDDSLDNRMIIGWLNRCQAEISPYANYQKSVTIHTEQAIVPLPSDCVEVREVIEGMFPLPEVRTFGQSGYKKFGREIVLTPFTEPVTIDIVYTAKLPDLKLATDEPQLPPQYHELLVLYAVAKAKYADEDFEAYQITWGDYVSRLQEYRLRNYKDVQHEIIYRV